MVKGEKIGEHGLCLTSYIFQAVQNYFDENGQYFGYQQDASPRQQAEDRTLDIELKVIFC